MFYTWLLKLEVYLFRKPRFKDWCRLEDRKYKLIRAAEKTNEEFPQSVHDYVSAALIFPINLSRVFWKDEIKAFYRLHSVSSPDIDLPLLNRNQNKKDNLDPWSYSGRIWFLYSNIIAKAYGWSEKQIANLRVEDALAYIQEILTDEQLEREFVHSLSELSYEYQKETKKSKYRPLQRPYWMQPDITKVEEKKMPKVPKHLIPVGLIENKNEEETKKIRPL